MAKAVKRVQRLSWLHVPRASFLEYLRSFSHGHPINGWLSTSGSPPSAIGSLVTPLHNCCLNKTLRFSGSCGSISATVTIGGPKATSTVANKFALTLSVVFRICGPISVPTPSGWYRYSKPVRTDYVRDCGVALCVDWMSDTGATIGTFVFYPRSVVLREGVESGWTRLSPGSDIIAYGPLDCHPPFVQGVFVGRVV